MCRKGVVRYIRMEFEPVKLLSNLSYVKQSSGSKTLCFYFQELCSAISLYDKSFLKLKIALPQNGKDINSVLVN